GGDLLVGTDAGVAARLSPAGRGSVEWCAQMNSPVRSFLAESDGVLVGTLGAGLQRLDPATGVIIETLIPGTAGPGAQVAALHRDRDGTLLVGTFGGLALVDDQDRVEWLVPDPDDPRSLPDASVSAIAPSRDRSVWIGTWNGVVWLPPTWSAIRSVRHTSTDPLPGEGVVAMAHLGSKTMLAGGLGGGLFTIPQDDRPRTIIELGDGVGDSRVLHVFDIEQAGDAALIATVGGGLLTYSDGSIEKVADEHCDGRRTGDLVAVHQGSDGTVWVGSVEQGLLILDGQSRRLCTFVDNNGEAPFDAGYIWPIVESGNGGIVFGVHTRVAGQGGVVALDQDGSWRWLFQGRDAREGTVMTLHLATDSTLWVGTQGAGLIRVKPGNEMLKYAVSDGLPNPTVNGVLEDGDGNIWISTEGGLARLDPSTGSIRVFHESSGLSDDRFLANSALKDEDGRLFFGGPSGITIVDPVRVSGHSAPPTAALAALRINGEEAPVDRALQTGGADLEPHENFFTFTFAALDFADPSSNQYRYQLVGLDEGWIDNGNIGVANYTSVPPGDYTFRVAARASEGIWNEDALSIPVHVQTPWQETWWARSAGILLLLSAITGIYLYRLRQIEAREALRLGIAGKLHDDIGANLSAMALKTELVRTATELTEGKRKHLKDIGRLARDTAHKVRETAWIVNTEYDSLPGLASKMRDTAHTLLDGQVDVEFTGVKQLPRRPIDMELRQDTYLLFKELLQNVLKHSQATKAEIDIRFASPLLQVRVQDNGVGFDMDEANGHSGNGLVMMRKRAAKHGGAVEFATTSENGGTNALLTMRMK
ncbi:MAG: sensor histidine kinase, partial [Longimicrobiales bacterium]